MFGNIAKFNDYRKHTYVEVSRVEYKLMVLETQGILKRDDDIV
jgi:hypothetical protein